MPTLLPQNPRAATPKKRSLFDVLLNSFMLVTALVLTYVVLVREERYALGHPDPVEMAAQADPTGSIDRSDHRGIPEPR